MDNKFKALNLPQQQVIGAVLPARHLIRRVRGRAAEILVTIAARDDQSGRQRLVIIIVHI